MFWKKRRIIKIKIEQIGSLLIVKLFENNIRKARIQGVINPDNTILIGDIIHDYKKDLNKGYGSVMMKKLLEYSKENSVSCIYGNLSKVDIDHKERLYHFYEKFGFTITEYTEKKDVYFGMIEKII